jgi:hypothetical protein
MQWYYGDEPEEDHAAAVFFNINGAEYTKDRIAAQQPESLPPTPAARILDARAFCPHDGGSNEFGA